ncbi:hypothetical protein ABT282_08260 [Streptomyces sp. NPDC000927]|uniref:hypothetical protein n=1 Tax=Streptomyces sp. NPDC000927 TaxID=3154371 RepID=UPI00332F4A04
MNKATKAAITAAVLSLTLTACGGDHQYKLKGRVESKQIDQDCHTSRSGNLNAFSLPMKTGGSSGSRSGGGNSSGSRSGGGSSSSGGGVSLDKKPSEPRKVDSLPPIPDGPDMDHPRKTASKSCKPEYELFIRNSEGIFEQDVTADHYRKCDKREEFPRCTR